jgi:hypothetical protein
MRRERNTAPSFWVIGQNVGVRVRVNGQNVVLV